MINEKVLVYLGPSLDHDTARSILPSAIYRPPIKHADLISDIHIYNPTHVIIIDGEFHQSLSVWHKELVYALQIPSIIGIYGAASMGALRAAELADFGMVGIGKIFWWFYEGVFEDDALVAVQYHKTPSGEYVSTKAPIEELSCAQKSCDAVEALTSFREALPLTSRRPSYTDLSPMFLAMFERDRMVDVLGTRIPLQNIDAYVSLNAENYHEILWDAQNRALVLVLCDLLGIVPTVGEIAREEIRFYARHIRCATDEFRSELGVFLKANCLTPSELEVLMIQNARIRKAQYALSATLMYRRKTQIVLDHLRTHNRFDTWAESCREEETLVTDKDQSEFVVLDPGISLFEVWKEHLNATGQWIDGDISEYLKETGLSSISELSCCLQRAKLARKLANGRPEPD